MINFAVIEADIEIKKSNIAEKTINFYEKNPVCIDYYVVSEINDVLQSCYQSSLLGYDYLFWFVDELISIKKLSSLEKD